jgi:hypothetical protein
VRAAYLVGALAFVFLVTGLSLSSAQNSPPSEATQGAEPLGWPAIVVIFIVPGVLILAVTVLWGWPFLVLGLLAPVVLVWIGADSLWGCAVRLTRGRDRQASP